MRFFLVAYTIALWIITDPKVKVGTRHESRTATDSCRVAWEWEESERARLKVGNENNGEIREWRRSCPADNNAYVGIDRRHTVLLSGCVNRPVVGHPLIHLDEFGYEARYFAFHDRAVSPDHVLVFGLSNVELRNHCRQCINSLRYNE